MRRQINDYNRVVANFVAAKKLNFHTNKTHTPTHTRSLARGSAVDNYLSTTLFSPDSPSSSCHEEATTEFGRGILMEDDWQQRDSDPKYNILGSEFSTRSPAYLTDIQCY
ncbi:hypothetical protein PV326_012087 [Microctonus aethiopoides]|nr:hypothetical protein PV326_012087 [Microctonus aethiopoides]